MPPQAKKPPIKKPLSCSYAPTDAAKCKQCQQPIPKESIRFERKVHSRFHEGIDTQYYHIECGWDFATSLYDLNDWATLKWSDVLYVARLFGEVLDAKHPVVKYVQMHHKAATALAKKLNDLIPEKVLKDIALSKTVEYPARRRTLEWCKDIVDALIHGMLPVCPICKDQLVGRYPTIRCHGVIEGLPCGLIWNEVDILCPDKPSLEKLPAGVAHDSLAREGPLRFPQSVLNLSGVLNELREHFLAYPRSPCILKFGPIETWIRQTKRKRKEGDDDDNSEPDLEEGDYLPLKGMALYPINERSRHLSERIRSTGASVADTVEQATYCIVSEGHAQTDLMLPITNEAVGLGRPILNDLFLKHSMNPSSSLPCCLPAKRKKGVDYTRYLGPDDNGRSVPVSHDHCEYPFGLYLRQRRYASWFWAGKGGLPLDIEHPIIRFEEIRKKRKLQRQAEKEKEALRKRPPIIPNSDLVFVDPQASAEMDALDLSNVEVIQDQDNQVYHVYLTAADVTTGINKYYKMQCLACRDTSGQRVYYLMKSWGRIGGGGIKDGFKFESYHGNKNELLAYFSNMCRSMTGIEFDLRYHNSPVPGKYVYKHIKGYENEEDTEDQENRPPSATSDLPICDEVHSLLNQLFDEKQVDKWFSTSSLDVSSSVLETIDIGQIKNAMEILSKLESIITEDATRDSLSLTHQCEGLSNLFYSSLPHKGNLTPITTLQQVRIYTQVLSDFLSTLQTRRMVRDQDQCPSTKGTDLPLTDKLYPTLQCDIAFISPEDYSSFEKTVVEAVKLRGPTHSFKLEAKRIFSLSKTASLLAATSHNEVTKRRFLWHGSLASNWAGILASGLRCAPKEAPKTGYMFGKGIYFADTPSKSAQYCLPRPSSHAETIFLMLSEVVLGDPIHACRALFSSEEDFVGGQGHIHAHGKYSLDTASSSCPAFPSTLPECQHSVSFFTGPLKFHHSMTTELLYDEYVVFDRSRVIPRLLVEVLRSPLVQEMTEDNPQGLLNEGEISEDSD